ncbi:hypothetical protein HY497_00285 [Candidatus Woesearchaeota archaeon]|nr:hypothetical protein [Candidatus Woesearchaeota archaeon]
MDVRQLKAAAAALPRIDTLAVEFEQHVKGLEGQYTRVRSLKQLRQSLKEIKYGQVVNEKLASLAHQLVELKLASVTSDYKKARRIVSSFLKDPHVGIKRVIFEVPYLESQISLFHNSYVALMDKLSMELPLEQSVALADGRPLLKKLCSISEQQKNYVSLIGKHFVEMTRELKGKKEFRQAFKKTLQQ